MPFIDQGSGSGSRSETFRLLHAKNIVRPQLKFREKVDNSNTPFVPKIFIKPNAVKPLPSCKKLFTLILFPILCFHKLINIYNTCALLLPNRRFYQQTNP